ncbi:hypothetical protein JBKA6_0895 [Ichthyobacterium seriolicida]|uniref:Uncharacterized protein n=1 Tax=Ichthyobacterium seriolicida TaxID=242600 RepID=A0A1J1E4D5_9FLAO|nr:hypothetical protein JBKA6_0895 [Ichthyobacterium seriolicida]
MRVILDLNELGEKEDARIRRKSSCIWHVKEGEGEFIHKL